ncbi:hypothetical protein [Paraburkholderia unamae]|uniref:Uncharacterized protein n=1 Tax=Paraburkholderia unamae TaxID=219649 RepID=A0ABX5KR33_9BURK|nr:hypothetical protein [Paraburkholderia unamae]PVX84323.1 hypothetical protein C7402_105164 [Paraburkholderia unamae]
MARIERCVRITIEQMTEPDDVLLAEIEADHVIETDIDGEVLDSFAIVNGAKLPIPVSEDQMNAFYRAAWGAAHV